MNVNTLSIYTLIRITFRHINSLSEQEDGANLKCIQSYVCAFRIFRKEIHETLLMEKYGEFDLSLRGK